MRKTQLKKLIENELGKEISEQQLENFIANMQKDFPSHDTIESLWTAWVNSTPAEEAAEREKKLANLRDSIGEVAKPTYGSAEEPLVGGIGRTIRKKGRVIRRPTENRALRPTFQKEALEETKKK